MPKFVNLYISKLESKDIKYDTPDDNVVKVSSKLKNIDDATVIAFFAKEDDPYVSFKSIIPLSFTEKSEAALIACNEVNNQYRWVKFYLDDDGTVYASLDAILCEANCGAACFELLIRMMNIIDEVFPIFAKARWA